MKGRLPRCARNDEKIRKQIDALPSVARNDEKKRGAERHRRLGCEPALLRVQPGKALAYNEQRSESPYTLTQGRQGRQGTEHIL